MHTYASWALQIWDSPGYGCRDSAVAEISQKFLKIRGETPKQTWRFLTKHDHKYMVFVRLLTAVNCQNARYFLHHLIPCHLMPCSLPSNLWNWPLSLGPAIYLCTAFAVSVSLSFGDWQSFPKTKQIQLNYPQIASAKKSKSACSQSAQLIIMYQNKIADIRPWTSLAQNHLTCHWYPRGGRKVRKALGGSQEMLKWTLAK